MRRILLLAGILLLSACFSSTGSGLHYEMSEFTISGATTLPAGESVIHIANTGEFTHTFVLTDSDGSVVAASDVLAAGETAELTVDVGEGQYMITCRLVVQTEAGGLVDHFEQGMHLPLEVTG